VHTTDEKEEVKLSLFSALLRAQNTHTTKNKKNNFSLCQKIYLLN